jgi:type VI secretion system protein VasG
MSNELRNLIGKLNPICRRGLETAAALCVAQTHYNVEVEHLLLKLLDLPATDLAPVLRYHQVDTDELTRQLDRALEGFDRGNSRTPAMSPQILHLLREGWQLSSLQLESAAVRSGALLLALFEDETLRAIIHDSCPVLAKIPRESLRETLRELIRDSAEESAEPSSGASGVGGGAGAGGSAGAAGAPGAPGDDEGTAGGSRTTAAGSAAGGAPKGARTAAAAAGKTTALDRYTLDLTAEARAGAIDPIRGRDGEIRQVIDVLTRRRQNNPILVGDAGVGKTAIAEGFALRVAAGDVPAPLREISLRILDLGLLQAGAGVKGEFEERLKSVIAEVKAAPRPVILFIDEAHTLIGAGGQAGQGDAANLLKPALARGELRTIAATTWSEYKKYFEKDPALARRFQLVKVDEPDEERALDMLRGIAPRLELHHQVRILDEAVRGAVQLSHRYLPERRLPDKAIGVLDTAAARVALAQDGTPPAVEDLARRLRIGEAAPARRRAAGSPPASWQRSSPGCGATATRCANAAARSASWWPRSAAWRRRVATPPAAGRSWRRCRATSRWCRSPSTRAPWPPWSPAGPASPPAACSPTRSAASSPSTSGWPSASSASRRRSTPSAGASRPRARAWRTRPSRRGSSCSSVRPAWARPRPLSRSPICSMAASATWFPSTCPSSRRRIRWRRSRGRRPATWATAKGGC